MRLVHTPPEQRTTAGAIARLALLAAAVTAAAVTAAGASAATSARAAAASLCSTGQLAAADVIKAGSPISPTSVTSISSLEALLKAEFAKIKQVEPILLGAASGSIKADLQTVFNFENMVIADVVKANYNLLALAGDQKLLVGDAAKVKPALARLKVYFDTTCHYHVG